MQEINYSIIIPHHNIPNLLQRCLDSIPVRDDIQVVVVDDNSSSEIVDFDNFPGANRSDTELYFTKEGKGAGYARNVGLKHAKGKWIIFADADDYFTSTMSEILDKYLNSTDDVIYFKSSSVDSITLQPSTRAIGYNNTIDLYINKQLDPLDLGLNYNVPWGKIIRHNIIQYHALKFSETRASNDVYFATKLALMCNKISADCSYLYCVTLRQGSLTTTPSLSLLYDRLNERLKSNQLLIDYNHKKHLASVMYIIYCIYRVGGFKETLKALRIVTKSSTPLLTGCFRWIQTIVFIVKNNIHNQNC